MVNLEVNTHFKFGFGNCEAQMACKFPPPSLSPAIIIIIMGTNTTTTESVSNHCDMEHDVVVFGLSVVAIIGYDQPLIDFGFCFLVGVHCGFESWPCGVGGRFLFFLHSQFSNNVFCGCRILRSFVDQHSFTGESTAEKI